MITEGTFFADNIIGTEDHDKILGLSGNDTIRGLGGSDYIEGNADDDLLFGNQGNDTLVGGEGDDILMGDGQPPISYENTDLSPTFDDALFGNQGEDTLIGGQGEDYLDGGEDNDMLFGNQDNDELFGGKGDDILTGGTGIDILSGDEGRDLYVFLAKGYHNGAVDLVSDAIATGESTDQVYFDVKEDQLAISGINTRGNLMLLETVSVETTETFTIEKIVNLAEEVDLDGEVQLVILQPSEMADGTITQDSAHTYLIYQSEGIKGAIELVGLTEGLTTANFSEIDFS